MFLEKDSIRTILPPKAGFTKLSPMPPKNCLITIIETNAPTTTISRGIFDGRLNAKRMPVTTADKSHIVFGLFIIFLATNSKRTQLKTLTPVTSSVLGPKNQTDAARAGKSAIITSSIIVFVVRLFR